jgi:hypothetical protein
MIHQPDVPMMTDARDRQNLLEQNLSWGRMLSESKWQMECQGLQGFDAAHCGIQEPEV